MESFTSSEKKPKSTFYEMIEKSKNDYNELKSLLLKSRSF